MTNTLAAFLRERMDERGLRNRDVEQASGLSRQVVSKWVSDRRERLTRLPERSTLEGLARALGVPTSVLLGKAVEALGLGYTSGDFVNGVRSASDDELLDEMRQRLGQVRHSARVDLSTGELASLLQALEHTALAEEAAAGGSSRERRLVELVEELRATDAGESSSEPGVSA